MNDFSHLNYLDHENMKIVGFERRNRLTGRAADLSAGIVPLGKISPDLRSRYLVKGWLDRGAFSVVYGQSNVGKTFFAMDLALHVAAGEDWHGSRVPEGDKHAGPVLYVAAEGGRGIRNRIAAIRKHNPELMAKVEEERGLSILSEPLDLCTAEDAKYLIEAIAEGFQVMPSLIVIDTLARVMGSGDENTAKDMGQLVRAVDDIRAETGAHVMIIHHSGKDESKGARGSGSLRAAADTEIELTRNDGIVQAEARKQRDLPCDGIFAYSLKSVHIGFDEDGDQVASAVVVPAEPVKRKVKLPASAKIALQALDDCIRDHGQKMHDTAKYPANRKCVSVDQWRDMCDRHSLSHGEGNSAKRTAFMRAKNTLHEKEIVRIVDGYVWRVGPDETLKSAPIETPSQVSQPVTSDTCDTGQSSVTRVTHPYKGCDDVTVTQPENSEADRSQGECDAGPVNHDPNPFDDEPDQPDVSAADPDAHDPEMWQ